MTSAGRVLHLVPPNGGGVDRFVRDLCAHRREDWLLHVSDEQCVVECPGGSLFVPVALADLEGLVERGVLGRAAALHAHSTVPAVRKATQIIASRMHLRYLVTLHDVQFSGASEDLDKAEIEQRLEFIRNAAHVTVPSGFMRGLALEVMGHGFDCDVVENGVDGRPAALDASAAQQFPIAVIGAMGEHKGLGHLVDVASQLPSDLRIALLGYADGELGPGWLVPGRIWVHGVFEPDQLPRLAAQYGAQLAFFPKGQPESYCYALSDAWLAGLPVVAPDWGAIGERVRNHGGGSLYDPDASAEAVARIIAGQIGRADGAPAAVKAAAMRLTPVATMVDTMNKLYADVAAAQTPADVEALRLSASNNLDGRFFRRELLRLQGDLSATVDQRDNALKELRTLADNFDRRGLWIDHLQQSFDELQAVNEGMRKSIDEMRLEQDKLQARTVEFERLQTENLALRRNREATMNRLDASLRWLPATLQTRILSSIKKMLFGGQSND